MTDDAQGSLPTTVGSELEIMAKLWDLCLSDADPIAVAGAVERVQMGHRVFEAAGRRFEVVDPEWSIVQDVYGCEHGRDCTDVTAADRVAFEAMIAARLEAQA